MDRKHTLAGVLRISLGWIFLWSFLDKVFGLGFTTSPSSSWMQGVSPTSGWLQHATYGPFAPFLESLAGYGIVDWLFMLGLLGVGVALILGVAKNLAVISGVAMMLMMYLGALPPQHNPLIDEHIIYSVTLLLFLTMPVEDWIGMGEWWKRQRIVRKYPILR